MKRMLVLSASVLATVVAQAQTRLITGQVLDAAGKSVAGATIKIKGSTAGVAADANGNFSINAKEGDVLVITALNFPETEAPVGTSNTLNITMGAASGNSLTEVVVTGYTSFIKKKSAGSSVVVSAEKVKDVPLGSFDQILQGQASGLQVTANSGQPGAAASVQIRGKGSVNGTTTPLYVVDGIQINANDFSTLNPGDFESITVLKDASSTAIYGSRGANGVIVVTTKKGRNGRTIITYDGQMGFSKFPNPRLDVMNSAQKLDYELNSPNPNGPNPYGWTPAEVEELRQINTNWQDVLFQTGRTSSHQLSAAGGNEKTRFYLSGSIFDQTGIVKYTGLKRYTTRFNIDNQMGDFRFGLNTQIGYSIFNNTQENDAFIGSPLNAIRWANPYEKPFDDNGRYTQIVSGQPNPLQEIEQNRRNFYQLKGVGNVYAQYNFPFLQGLSFRANLGADYTQDENNVYLDPATYQGRIATGQRGSLNRSLARSFRYTVTNNLSYTTRFGGDHELTANLFQEYIQRDLRSFGFTGFGLTLPNGNEFAITPGNATNNFIPAVVGNGTVNSLASYFADVNYGYKGRYYLNASVRRDGSSRFGSNNQYATFGAIGASWSISDEKFMENAKRYVNSLRLKASYGTAGSQEGILDFGSRTLFGRSTYAGNSFLFFNQYGNPDLVWETKAMLNVGLDFSMFSNRLRGTVEWYDNQTRDVFIDRRLSLTSGQSSINFNAGRIQNTGVDVGIQGTIIKSRDFSFDLGVNYTHNKNRIRELFGNTQEQVDGNIITRVGSPLNSWYLVPVAGVNPQTGEQLYRQLDGRPTADYNPNDRVVLGTADAPNFGGVNASINFKGLELSTLFTYAFGNYLYNNDRQNLENPNYLFDNLSVNMINEWRTPGQVTNIPDPNNIFRAETDRFLEKGDFMRLRNLTLAYSLPKSVIGRLKMQNIRVFAQGQNLVTWTNFLGYDPEVSVGTLQGAQYPALRTVTFGLNASF